MNQVRKYSWIKYLGWLGLVAAFYQSYNLITAIIRNSDYRVVIYTIEIILLVVLFQASLALLRKVS